MSSDFHLPPGNPLSILQSIVVTAIDGIFLMNASGIILMCNPAAGRLFGYEHHFLIGQDIKLLMPSPHKELHDKYVHNYLNTGIKKIIGIGREIQGLRKDGTLFPARLAVSEIIMDDENYFTGIIHDLTDVKAIENKLLQLNQELEQLIIERTTELQDAVNRLLDTNQLLNDSIEKHKAFEEALLLTRDELKKSLENEKELGNLKSRFISMASHEFKTPLSSILSSAALITRYNHVDQEGDRERHVERIKASVTHLNTILTDFLSITKLEEGRFSPHITTFQIDTVVADLLSEMEVLLKNEQSLTFEYKTTQLVMQSDKNIVRNILYNLLSNAIKYSAAKSAIVCKVKRKGKHMIIDIRDQGMGIPVADRKHIGSRFFRASNVSHLQGTGLGLNIVKSYLGYLKGDLTFRNHGDSGTTFIVTIPVVYEA